MHIFPGHFRTFHFTQAYTCDGNEFTRTWGNTQFYKKEISHKSTDSKGDGGSAGILRWNKLNIIVPVRLFILQWKER